MSEIRRNKLSVKLFFFFFFFVQYIFNNTVFCLDNCETLKQSQLNINTNVPFYMCLVDSSGCLSEQNEFIYILKCRFFFSFFRNCCTLRYS